MPIVFMVRMFSRSYLTVTFGFALRALSLGVLVVMLARTLGPSDFGGYAAAASLASFFSMFSGLGAGPLHVRDVAHAKLPYEVSLNHTVHRIGWTFLPLTIVAMACAWFVIPHNVEPLAIVLIVMGETMNYAGSDLAVRILQARERYTAMSLAICATPTLRIIVVAALMATGSLGLFSWAIVSVATGALMCAVVIGAWAWRMRGNLGSRVSLLQDSVAGLGFAVATAASRVHGDADKVVLARLVSTATAGTYTVAYRLTDIFLLPISAGVERMLPVLFKHGQHGLRQSIRTSATKVGLVLAFALALSCCVYMAASLLPWILGKNYLETVPIAHALSAVPFTATCWIIVRTLAATAGYERSTGVFELAGALFNVGATVVLVMAWDWRGAVVATYLTHVAMAATFCIYVICRPGFARGRQSRSKRAAAPAVHDRVPPDHGNCGP